MFIYYVYAESYTMGCDRLDVRKKTDTHTHTHTHTLSSQGNNETEGRNQDFVKVIEINSLKLLNKNNS